MELDEKAGQSQTTVHALLLSFPTKTHLIPLLQLAKRLASVGKHKNCCKFVFTSIVSYQLAGETGGGGGGGCGEEGEEAEFTLRTIAVPDGLASGRGLDMLGMIQACANMKASTLRFLPHLRDPPLSLIIADLFVPWAADLAISLGLPLFFFFTSNASSCCVMSHAPSLLARHIIPFHESRQQELVACPGAPALLPRDFPVSMQLQDIAHPQLQFTSNLFSHLEEASGLILNTCHEIEEDAVKVLQARCPIYTVGPLFLADVDSSTNQKQVGGGGPTDDCLQWLDAQATGSVLYVSFGTLANFTNEQMQELALGLEKSQQPFLWVVHKNVFNGTVRDALPEGFLERVKDRCFVTSWAPQLQVLKHRSVGGFFSHCGWNSILENISLNGVPMLCWPDKAEQGVNARLVVDVWKLGVPFKVGKECSVSCDEVEAAVKSLMQGEVGQETRRRGAELKKQVEDALRIDGSSMVNLEALVMTMRTKVLNK